MKTNISNMQST